MHIWSAVSTIHLLALEPRGELRFLQTIFHSKTIIFRLRVVIAPCMWIEIHKIKHKISYFLIGRRYRIQCDWLSGQKLNHMKVNNMK